MSEQFDTLLGVVGTQSLKSDARLWTYFQHLKQARNSFVHQGVPVMGKQRVPVTEEQARALVAAAEEIVQFVEAQLPLAARTPRNGALVNLQLNLRKL